MKRVITSGGYAYRTNLSAPFDEGWTFTLMSNRIHMDFDTLEELRDEIQDRGLPSSLGFFDRDNYSAEDGYIKNRYQNYATYAYPPTNGHEWYEDYDEAVKNRIID